MAKKAAVAKAEPPKSRITERLAEMNKIVAGLNKAYGEPGEPVIMCATDMLRPLRVGTGILSLDHQSGGGYARGKFSMIWGPENAGKTTTLLMSIARAMKRDPDLIAMFIDCSGRFDAMLGYAQTIGVDMLRFFPVETNTLQEAIAIFHQTAKAGLIDICAIDDLAASASIKEQYKGSYEKQQERSMVDQSMGAQALANAEFIRRTKDLVNKKQVAMVFTQQVRANTDPNGSDFIIPGGHALKHILVFNHMMRQGPAAEIPTVDSTIAGVRCGFSMASIVTKMAIDGAQFPGHKTVTQFVHGRGVEPGRDAYCFLNAIGAIKVASAQRTLNPEILAGLDLDFERKFMGRRVCEDYLAENHDQIYNHFVPNTIMQCRPDDPEVLTARRFDHKTFERTVEVVRANPQIDPESQEIQNSEE